MYVCVILEDVPAFQYFMCFFGGLPEYINITGITDYDQIYKNKNNHKHYWNEGIILQLMTDAMCIRRYMRFVSCCANI